MSAYIVPIFIIIVLLYASCKNLNTYNIFVNGAKGAIDLVVSIFPYIVAILVSVALLSDIYTKYGADSYISRCASVIMGSSETVFYVATVYFSQTKVKKLLYAIPCALVASLVAAIVSCLICRVI